MSDFANKMSVAALRTAETAIREEPYPRLPALAGTLAMAAHRLEAMQAENERLHRRIDAVSEIDLTDHSSLVAALGETEQLAAELRERIKALESGEAS